MLLFDGESLVVEVGKVNMIVETAFLATGHKGYIGSAR